VPSISKSKFQAIRERFRVEPFHLRIVYTSTDEFDLASDLTTVACASHPLVAIGSYPNFGCGDFKVKLTLEVEKDESALEPASHDLLRLSPSSIVQAES
jgi:hypothetical protein